MEDWLLDEGGGCLAFTFKLLLPLLPPKISVRGTRNTGAGGLGVVVVLRGEIRVEDEVGIGAEVEGGVVKIVVVVEAEAETGCC